MSKSKGIDVSTWNGKVDFKKVKAAGIDFVIIRAGYGKLASQKDSTFETNYKNAVAAGLKVGVYWYSYAVSVAEALLEAEACLKCVGKKKLDLPIYFDMEDPSTSYLSKATLTKIAKKFCKTIVAAGYKAGIYSSLYWFNSKLDYAALKEKYSIWLAQWASKNQLDCDIWQYSDKGKVNGNGSTYVDMNVAFINIAKTPVKPATTDEKKTTTTSTVKAGKSLKLKDTPLYVSSTAEKKATTVTGTYYLWDASKVNGRYRITNSKANVGNASAVTGWIAAKHVK